MPKISAATVKEHHEQVFNKLVEAAEIILREQGPNALTAGDVAKAAGIARNSIYRYVSSIDDLRLVVLERYLPLWVNSVKKRINPKDDPRKQILDLTLISLEMAQTTGHTWLISVMRHHGGMRAKNMPDGGAKTKTTGGKNAPASKVQGSKTTPGAEIMPGSAGMILAPKAVPGAETVPASLATGNPRNHITVAKQQEYAGENSGSERSPYNSLAVANFHKNLANEILQLWKQIDPRRATVNAQINRALIETGMKMLDQNSDFHTVAYSVCVAVKGMFPNSEKHVPGGKQAE